MSISYATKGDFLDTLTVTEYSAAHLIATRRNPTNKSVSSIIRFDGGISRWTIKADLGLSGGIVSIIPGMGSSGSFAINSVTYGRVPPGFAQVEPAAGTSPEPLGSGRYYIFEVERGSGSRSYFAIRGEPDGRITGFDAEPRAGSSFELCCSVPADFAPLEQESPTADQNL